MNNDVMDDQEIEQELNDLHLEGLHKRANQNNDVNNIPNAANAIINVPGAPNGINNVPGAVNAINDVPGAANMNNGVNRKNQFHNAAAINFPMANNLVQAAHVNNVPGAENINIGLQNRVNRNLVNVPVNNNEPGVARAPDVPGGANVQNGYRPRGVRAGRNRRRNNPYEVGLRNMASLLVSTVQSSIQETRAQQRLRREENENEH